MPRACCKAVTVPCPKACKAACRRAVAHLALIALLMITGLAPATAPAQTTTPEKLAAQAGPVASVRSSLGVVATDHIDASRAGVAMLEAGGNAADAGVAAMLALGVVNPAGSGLGGGGFCLYRESKSGVITALDFREVAPQGVDIAQFTELGELRPERAMYGGLAVGVPGEPAGLWALHGRFGALPWADAVKPALTLAQEGFVVGPHLAEQLRASNTRLEPLGAFGEEFGRREGQWPAAGEQLKRPRLARALALLGEQGVLPFYNGVVAQAIAQEVQRQGGVMTPEDLAAYRVIPREPLVGEYRGHAIYTMGLPSSGGLALLQTLNVLSGLPLGQMGYSAQSMHLFVEAQKHAFAERARWPGDPDFVQVPMAELLSEGWAQARREQILPDSVRPLDSYGAHMPGPSGGGTSHVSIVDAQDNMLACTTTINTRFGAMVLVQDYGLVLNNQMGDFNLAPGQPNIYGLVGSDHNALQARKRPLSSMAPTLVLRDARPVASLGASGGPAIISATTLSLVHLLDFGLGPQELLAMPRFHHQWLPDKLWTETRDEVLQKDLAQRGHRLEHRPSGSAVQLVVVGPDGVRTAASDPRKHGAPAAQKPQ